MDGRRGKGEREGTRPLKLCGYTPAEKGRGRKGRERGEGDDKD